MLDFTTPIDTAYQRMKKILFEPFRFEKWLAIGFCAFLAAFVQGGYGGSFNWPGNRGNWSSRQGSVWGTHHAPHWTVPHWVHGPYFLLIICAGVAAFFLILALLIVLWWLGCRGRFMFIDNVVHDRGEVRRPWREFRSEGNSLFLFYLVVGFFGLAVLCVFGGIGLILLWPFLTNGESAFTGPILMSVGVLCVFLIVWFALALFLFLFAEFGVPLIYLRRIRPLEALKVVWRLCLAHPFDMVIYILFRFLLGMLFFVVACMVICLTCCLSALPYVGSVVFLPLTVFIQCYTLDILRQFGPDYDLWTLAEPPNPPPQSPPPPPIPA